MWRNLLFSCSTIKNEWEDIFSLFHSSSPYLPLSSSPHFIHLFSLQYITSSSPHFIHLFSLQYITSYSPHFIHLFSLRRFIFLSSNLLIIHLFTHITRFRYSLNSLRFLVLSSWIGYERTEQSEGWGEGGELITRIQVVRAVSIHRLLLLLG